MATRRRTTRRTTSTTRRRRSSSSSLPTVPLPSVGPEVARSILGIIFLVLGAVTLIALALPGQGALTDWWRNSIAPWFETGRWALPFLLLGAGAYLEFGPGKRPGSGWAPRSSASRSPSSGSSARSRSSTSRSSAPSVGAVASAGFWRARSNPS